MRARFVVIACAACLVGACGRGFFDTPPVQTDAGSATDGATGDGATTANFVFATSTIQNGDLGGLAGADAICQQRAIEAPLPGTYVAFLSASTGTATSRLSGSRGWRRVDGEPVVDQPQDIVNLHTWYPISLDELGRDARTTTSSTYSGTYADGTTTHETCMDWTSSAIDSSAYIGTVGASGTDLYNAGNVNCTLQLRLYCFGVGDHPLSAPTPASGRLAFVTASTFAMDAGGLATADALCQAEADGAGKPGTFLAALPTSTTTTASRFDLAGAPWVRADGIALTTTAADMFAGAYWRAPANLTVTGDPAPNNYWGGGPTQVATTNACNDWTDGTGDQSGSYGNRNATDQTRFATEVVPCSAPFPVMCLQK